VAGSLLATLGLYGGTLALAFLAGMFPLLSVEALLFAVALSGVAPEELAALVGIAAVGHQIAKTVTYYAGTGALALPGGRAQARIDAARRWIDRWNRRPRWILFASATIGLPPLYVLGLVARPLMGMALSTFTAISMSGRIARYVALVVAGHYLG